MDPEPEAEQEVEPFSGNAFTSGNTVRNSGSRVLHLFLIPPLLLVLALSVTSLSYFAVIDDKVGDKGYHCSGKCILFAKWNGDASCIDLSSGHACVFSIFGEVAVAVLSALLVVWMIVKASAGFHITTWVLVCEVPLLTLHMVFAFCVSITISIGLAFTCDAYGHVKGATGGCGNYSLTDPTTTDHPIHFYGHLKKSMVTSWLAVVVLFLLLCVHVFLIIFFCVKRVRKSIHELLPVSDGESSSDGDSTDEAMVPIAELERR